MRPLHVGAEIIADDHKFFGWQIEQSSRSLKLSSTWFPSHDRDHVGRILDRRNKRSCIETQCAPSCPISILLQGNQPRASKDMTKDPVHPVDRPLVTQITNHYRLGTALVEFERRELLDRLTGNME